MDRMHGMGRAVVTPAGLERPSPVGPASPCSTGRFNCRRSGVHAGRIPLIEQLIDKAVACFRVLLFNFRIEKGVCTLQLIERTCGWAVSHTGVYGCCRYDGHATSVRGRGVTAEGAGVARHPVIA